MNIQGVEESEARFEAYVQALGRGWRGFHHHATLCIAAYGFLICER
jgi:SRSO17 transposase